VADGQVVYDQSVSSNSDKWSAPPLSGVIWSGRWCGMSVSSRFLRAGFTSTHGVLVGAVASAGVGGSAPLFGGPGIIEVMLSPQRARFTAALQSRSAACPDQIRSMARSGWDWVLRWL